jgi:transposase InsO family protein
VSRFRFVDDHQDTYEVKRLCELVEVSRAGYYAWQRRPPCARAVADGALLDEIRAIHSESRCTYGAPWIHGQLRRLGQRIGCKRVARLMRQDRLMGVHKRRWRRRRPDIAPAPDRLNRNVKADKPNQRWVADITEFPTGEGKLHVAGVRDLCHRGLVGWSMSAHPDAELVVDAPVMALGRAEPDSEGSCATRARRRLRVGGLLIDGQPRRTPGVFRVDRGLLGQRRHGDVLVDPQTRDHLDPRQHLV